jgi:ribonuclease H2 subunit A
MAPVPGLDGTPSATRSVALANFETLVTGGEDPSAIFHSTSGSGLTFFTDVPSCCLPPANSPAGTLGPPVRLGIDEAGRGSALGPMTYGCAFWPVSLASSMEVKGFDDSKALTHKTRRSLLTKMENTPELGYLVRCLQSDEISRNMFRTPKPYNLNDMSHDAAMDMIRRVQAAGVNVTEVIIDTVGIPEAYLSKLDRAFSGDGIRFTVEKKADANHKVVSAASIAAKVARDEITLNWTFSERAYAPTDKDWASGYPSDPKCKKWLADNLADPVFCYPSVIRFSWKPIKDAMEERGVPVRFEADDEEDDKDKDGEGLQMSMADVFGCPKPKRQRMGGQKITRGLVYSDIV